MNTFSWMLHFPNMIHRTALLVTVFLLLINIFSGVVNDTPNTNDGRKNSLMSRANCNPFFYSVFPFKTDVRTHLFKVVIVWFFPEMTDLEFWTFMCIVSVFLSLLSYGVILIKDQMIIQVGSHKESFWSKTQLSNMIWKWGFQMFNGMLLFFCACTL